MKFIILNNVDFQILKTKLHEKKEVGKISAGEIK